ncbi:hypothetical protein KAI46_05420 [bacterium]|nr:hypothetical protein [bacterium]
MPVGPEDKPWLDLIELAQQLSPVWVACSGGIDSLWLFHFFKNVAAINVRPVFFDHPGVYPEERSAAQIVVNSEAGVVVEFYQSEMIAVWSDEHKERCYSCKHHLFTRAVSLAEGTVTICDGTHLGDAPERRPGMLALAELGILSPLRSCGWDKNMIRAAARDAGLKAWNQPARACLVVDGKMGI